MREKKFKTARGFLQWRYDREWHKADVIERMNEAPEAKRARSKLCERNAIKALLPQLSIPEAAIDDGEDLELAVSRLLVTEGLDERQKHSLHNAQKWLKNGQIIVLSSSFTGITTVTTNPDGTTTTVHS